MSRLQEYLKTPNPIHHLYFSPQSYHQDDSPNLFVENPGQQPISPDSIQSETSKPVSFSHLSQKKAEIPSHTMQIQQNNPKMISTKIKFEEEISQKISEEEIQTPLIKIEQNSVLQTTANKKYGVKLTGGFIPQSSDIKENERTLRFLTAQAYRVVCRKGSSTYKMVSQQIINCNPEMLSSKQQNNIKRRVYDALNVLIALGKLEKKGRKIIPNKNFELQRQHSEKLIELKKIISQKQANLKSKIKFYKNQSKKNLVLKKLINRNSIDIKSQKQKIYMPFVLAHSNEFKKQQKDIGCQVKLTVKRRQSINNFYGDLDVLSFIKFGSK